MLQHGRSSSCSRSAIHCHCGTEMVFQIPFKSQFACVGIICQSYTISTETLRHIYNDFRFICVSTITCTNFRPNPCVMCREFVRPFRCICDFAKSCFRNSLSTTVVCHYEFQRIPSIRLSDKLHGHPPPIVGDFHFLGFVFYQISFRVINEIIRTGHITIVCGSPYPICYTL